MQCSADLSGIETCITDVNGCTSFSTTACSAPETCDASQDPVDCVCPAVAAQPAVNGGCTTAGATACDAAGNVLACASVGSCMAWTLSDDCVGRSLECGAQTGNAACECAPNPGNDHYVDSIAGSDAVTSGVRPTGIASPAACRYGSLTYALSIAASGDRVVATGASTTTMQFTHASTGNSETFPLVVPAGVTLTTSDAPLTPANYAIIFNTNPGSTTPGAIQLLDGAELSGFTVTVGTGASLVTPLVACNAGSVLVDSVLLVGTQPALSARTGLAVRGTCSATVLGSTVRFFTATGGEGISFQTLSSSNSVSTSTVTTSVTGIRVRTGGVALDAVSLQNNLNAGLRVNPQTGEQAIVGATALTSRANSGPGVHIESAGTSRVALNGGSISSNARGNTPGNGINVTGTGVIEVSLDAVTVDDNGALGLAVTAASGVVTVTGGTLDRNGTANNPLSNGVGMSNGTVTITGSSVSNNVGGGLVVAGGTASISSATVDGNSGAGLTVSGGTVQLSDGTVSGNGGSGAVFLGGSTDATGTSFSGNGAQGVLLSATLGSAASYRVDLDGVTIDRNVQQGVEVLALANVDFSLTGDSSVSGNGASSLLPLSGVRLAGGRSTIGSTAGVVTIADNGAFGLHLAGGAATVTGATISTNGSGGVLVTPEVFPGTLGLVSNKVSSNTGHGIWITRSPASGNGTVLLVSGNTVMRNSGNGIRISPSVPGIPEGAVQAQLFSNVVESNTLTGIFVQNTNNGVRAAIGSNDVYSNRRASPVSLAQGGGIHFENQFTLSGFSGNKVHDNGGDQMTVAAGTFDISSAACLGRENQFYCYDTSSAVPSKGVFNLSTTGTVTAQSNGWHFGGTAQDIGGNVDASNACPMFTPPACLP